MAIETIIATELEPHGLDNQLIDHLNAYDSEIGIQDGILYYGYPVFKGYEDNTVKTNFLLISKKVGVVLFATASEKFIDDKFESLNDTYSHVNSLLIKSSILRKRKNLSFDIETKLFSPASTKDDEDLLSSIQDLNNFLIEQDVDLTQEQIDEIRSILEGAKALSKPTQRKSLVEDKENKLNILIKLEDEIINFDSEQRKAAINLINGPQRIRGLAGSGKTIILAMKAAYIHLQYPEKKILFTFYTKSLYSLIYKVISNFYRHFSGGEPNWENIDVLHAWGGYKVDGVYFNAAIDNGYNPLSYRDVQNKNDPFEFVCADLAKRKINSKYDYILIDEAQDLPDEFFRLCYKLATGNTGKDKNIVWAYDDLQTIFNIYTRTPLELFGSDNEGNPLVDLTLFSSHLTWGQSNDIVLHKCYRNPLDVLVTAHALGFGLYDEPVQILENIDHWKDVGYELIKGKYEEGENVVIRRNPENSPLSISKYQSKNEIIKTFIAFSMDQEINYIIKEIQHFIEQGLRPSDIMIISLDDRHAKAYFKKISYKLSDLNILTNNILASSSENPPFILDNMITLTTVHRAKGNEAACVFVLGIDSLYSLKKLRQTRNKIFTAFTRTKAWLRITGVGEEANHFKKEIDESLEKSPNLEFNVPNKATLDYIQRDLSEKEQLKIKFRDEVNKLKGNGFSIDEIEEEMQRLLGGYDND
ncbi:DEAD/DEAH box helicase [Acinetobacter pittii]|uniref:DEAD/DEAH box helicase n=1 Tax=Acinetobacter pittii TaxID=48296 RepID=UPI000A3D44B6|nr:ATP-binding domain-containing protein [Acinetobacter pittii]MCZ1177667.1 ATP-binding domain-containing protein [Acinetobacter pittii]OTU23947.1 hypothetical protein CAT62_00880 [Acinetobacter pittii]OTU50752.1 hypothetical protein CAT36_12455 [Acinetobacter pittii]QDB82002.1 hypothetical protein APMS7_06250 [Acinetobacter pittii]